jgi:hypothetical protein
MILDKSYGAFFEELKQRIYKNRYQAALHVNKELIFIVPFLVKTFAFRRKRLQSLTFQACIFTQMKRILGKCDLKKEAISGTLSVT